MRVLLAGGGTLADGVAEFLLQLEWAELVGLVAATDDTDMPASTRILDAGLRLLKPGDELPEPPDIFIAAERPAPHHLDLSHQARLGGVLVHLSLLPKHRGIDPVRWAILEGDPACGATVLYITPDAYCGNILAQEKEDIKDVHDAQQVEEILRGTARDMLVKVLHALAKIGPLPGTPQDLSGASEHKKPPGKARSKIDFSQEMTTVHRTIMGFCHPYGGAQAKQDQQTLIVWRARPLLNEPPEGKEDFVVAKHFKGDKTPGSVLEGPESRFGVRCGCGSVLELIEVQLGGRTHRPLPPAEVFEPGAKLT